MPNHGTHQVFFSKKHVKSTRKFLLFPHPFQCPAINIRQRIFQMLRGNDRHVVALGKQFDDKVPGNLKPQADAVLLVVIHQNLLRFMQGTRSIVMPAQRRKGKHHFLDLLVVVGINAKAIPELPGNAILLQMTEFLVQHPQIRHPVQSPRLYPTRHTRFSRQKIPPSIKLFQGVWLHLPPASTAPPYISDN